MKFLRRFLAPVLLSSWLILVAFGFLATGRVTLAFGGLGMMAGDIAFIALFVTGGMLAVGYPTGYFLARNGVSFWPSLLLLVVAGALGGAAIGFLMSLPGQALRAPGATLLACLIGALGGAITGSVWAMFNADLYLRAPKNQDG
jgi:hypothetical protein